MLIYRFSAVGEIHHHSMFNVSPPPAEEITPSSSSHPSAARRRESPRAHRSQDLRLPPPRRWRENYSNQISARRRPGGGGGRRREDDGMREDVSTPTLNRSSSNGPSEAELNPVWSGPSPPKVRLLDQGEKVWVQLGSILYKSLSSTSTFSLWLLHLKSHHSSSVLHFFSYFL